MQLWSKLQALITHPTTHKRSKTLIAEATQEAQRGVCAVCIHNRLGIKRGRIVSSINYANLPSTPPLLRVEG